MHNVVCCMHTIHVLSVNTSIYLYMYLSSYVSCYVSSYVYIIYISYIMCIQHSLQYHIDKATQGCGMLPRSKLCCIDVSRSGRCHAVASSSCLSVSQCNYKRFGKLTCILVQLLYQSSWQPRHKHSTMSNSSTDSGPDVRNASLVTAQHSTQTTETKCLSALTDA